MARRTKRSRISRNSRRRRSHKRRSHKLKGKWNKKGGAAAEGAARRPQASCYHALENCEARVKVKEEENDKIKVMMRKSEREKIKALADLASSSVDPSSEPPLSPKKRTAAAIAASVRRFWEAAKLMYLNLYNGTLAGWAEESRNKEGLISTLLLMPEMKKGLIKKVDLIDTALEETNHEDHKSTRKLMQKLHKSGVYGGVAPSSPEEDKKMALEIKAKLEKIIVLIDDGVLALKTEDIVSKLKMHSNFDG